MKNTDGLLHMYAYWARLEQNLGKDQAAARGVWESLIKIWFGQLNFFSFLSCVVQYDLFMNHLCIASI